jgi:hypothetical protein
MAETIWGFESRAMFEHRPSSVVVAMISAVLLFTPLALAPQDRSPAVTQSPARPSANARRGSRAPSTAASNRRFVPSESVSADKSLSFPVDI